MQKTPVNHLQAVKLLILYLSGIAIFRFVNVNTYRSAWQCLCFAAACMPPVTPALHSWLLIWKYGSGASNGDRGLLFFWSLMRMEDNILLRQFLFLFEETPSSYRRRSKHALTNGCWPSDCPRGDFPFELSNKVSFASLQNQSTEAFCWAADYPTRTLWRKQGKEHGCPSKPQFADDSQMNPTGVT